MFLMLSSARESLRSNCRTILATIPGWLRITGCRLCWVNEFRHKTLMFVVTEKRIESVVFGPSSEVYPGSNQGGGFRVASQ